MSQKIQELEKKILHHKALYYQGRPEISDEAFDQLEINLKKLDPENPVLSIIGSGVIKGKKVKHDQKMLSLDKTYSMDDLRDWIGEAEVVSSHKIDGVSCSLIYEDGKLILAKTRGDGKQGEKITEKILWLNTIPKKVSEDARFEIRGEIFCEEVKFLELCGEMEKIGLDRPSSQRNIVAGLMGRKDNIELARYLHFYAFEIIGLTDLKSEVEKFDRMNKLGFETPDYHLHKDSSHLENLIVDTSQFMHEGHYQIDGLVFTYNDIGLQNELGETSHHPRYKMAFKFSGESKTTIIESLNWQVSRNGILTPVAIVKPTELSGAKITNVTLHNYGVVRDHQLKPGDEIEIIRSGEVIPKFLSVVKSQAGKLALPENCPSCNEKVEIQDIRIYCRNKACPAQLKEGILNFIKKIGIDDLSSKRLDEMLSKGLITSIDDLYKLKIEDFLRLDKFKEKLATKLYDNIQNSKNINFTTFLSALGLTGGAYNKCEKIVQAGHDTVDKVLNMTRDDLMAVESFAEKSASELLKSLKSKKSLIKKLVKLGFDFEEQVFDLNHELHGKKICITGSLGEKRSIIEDKIRGVGGTTVSSVSKATDMLVCNDPNSTSSKMKKAKDLGISIVNEAELMAMLE